MTSQRGSAGLLAAALIAAAVVLSLLVMDAAQLVAARARLTTAADAAVLAAAPVTFASFGAAGDPDREAALLAAANGADLVECRCAIDRSWATRRVTVTVGLSVDLALLGHRELTATAAAEFSPVALGDR